jgi:hypothetical protein
VLRLHVTKESPDAVEAPPQPDAAALAPPAPQT